MKRGNIVKFLVILLSACSLVAAVAGGAAIVGIESAGLYVNSLDELQNQQYSSISSDIARAYAELYAAEQYSNLTYSMRQDQYPDPGDRVDAQHWTAQLWQGETLLEGPASVEGYGVVKQYVFTPKYPIVSLKSPSELKTEEEETGTTAPTVAEGRSAAYSGSEVPEDYLYYDTQIYWEGAKAVTYYYYYFEAPEYTVTVHMQPEVLESSALHILTALYPLRYSAIAVLAAGLLAFAAGMVYLCWAAGRTEGGEIRPGGLNALPLDLYAAVTATGELLLASLFLRLWDWVESEGPHPGNLSLLAINLLVITLLGIGFVFAFAAQIKIKNHYWWRHSLVGMVTGAVGKLIARVFRGIRSMMRMMPVIWQWLLMAAAMGIGVLLSFVLAASTYGYTSRFFLVIFLLCVAGSVGIVCYGGYCFGILLTGAQKMRQGNLSHKIPTRYLLGSFRDLAEQLNTLSETAMESAKRQMRSERMKTELITNVSHDIKTPLTSIINFVDLLQKPHTPEQQQQYLEVLSRQSGSMKRLIEDLMDLSKASTGNMTVNLISIDATETVNQALGEFADKLAAAELTPVFRAPAEPVMMKADGRLVWRVLSNLLGNTVKYAMPGTRLYIDLLRTQTQVILSLKNVSREAQSASAEELMERFVQGDMSRSAEGSGLGLNIAQSLMEVQGGKLRLLLDGDLFKVTLVFLAE